jgi:hypothetical protein
MTASERAAYNAGVRAALAHARKAAEALAVVPGFKLQGCAVEALEAFADEGTSLLVGKPVAPQRDEGL